MFLFPRLPPLALYIHIPWCVRKCPYCDFNSHALRGRLPEHEYVAALGRDLDAELPRVAGRVVHSVFFGGGTPSLLSPESVARLLSGIRARAPLAADAEVTLEANPGAAERGRLRGFREAGVTRLSLGIQSFDSEMLRALGRIHGPGDASRAAEAAHAAGFARINLDLMYGLPDQTPERALADVRRAIALAPDHLSAYQLTVEPRTAFHARPPRLPPHDAIWEIEQRLQDELARHSYAQYEVSAYARPGHQCRHNLNYWRFGDYLGIGAGAHGKVTDAHGITRRAKRASPRAYVRSSPAAMVETEQRLSPRDVALEFMLNALRLNAGFTPPLFPERAGLPLAVVEPPLQRAQGRGWIERDARVVRPSATGRRFLNDLLELFV